MNALVSRTLWRWAMCLLAGSSPSLASEVLSVHTALDRLVPSLLDGAAQEVSGGRVIHAVALDSGHYYAAFFAISGLYGGNSGGTYLALFESHDIEERSDGADAPGSVRLVAVSLVAWRGWRAVEPVNLRVEAGLLLLPATTHGPGDPACCPSAKSMLRFALERGNLVER